MVLYGVRLIINIFDLFIFRRYLETYLEKRKTTVEFSIILLILFEIAGSAVNQLEIRCLNLLILVIILSLYVCQYTGKIRVKAVAVALYMGLTVIGEPIGYMFYRVVADNLIQDEIVVYYFTAFTIEVFRMAVVELFCRIRSGRQVRVSLMPREVVYTLIMIPLASLVSSFLLIEVSKELLSAQTIVLCMCIIFTIVITNYLVFLMMSSYTAMAECRHEEEQTRAETIYQQEYYEDMEHYQEQIQNIKHDMKNRLSTLLDAAEKGDVDTLKEKLGAILGDIRFAEDSLYSPNPVFNSIMKIKVAKAKEQNIDVRVNAFLPQKLSIETGDMGVLYGNLLDNAIEACMQIEKGKRYIMLETKYQEGTLLAVIKNSKAAGGNRQMKTIKGDKRFHGRGLRSVRRIAEQYNGNVMAEDKGSDFEVTMLLTGIVKLE